MNQPALLVRTPTPPKRLLYVHGDAKASVSVDGTTVRDGQAFADYRRDQFGGWPWPDEAPVYDLDAPRFAMFGDGRIEHPREVAAQ